MRFWQYCWIQQGLNATWDPRAVHFPSPVSQWWAKVSEKGRKVFYTHGGTVCAGLGEDSLLRFAKFLGEEVGGWVSLEEGLPQHAFKLGSL